MRFDGINQQKLKRWIKKHVFPWLQDQPSPASPSQYEWSIGIYVGRSPVEFTAPEHTRNPVLTKHQISDVPAEFVADPFMIKVDQDWYMFFEVLNRASGKGEIGLAISTDGFQWHYQRIVLAEPFHLSYPYVFEWENNYYMIPETHQAGSVRLYKAKEFPTQWKLVKTLIKGHIFADTSIFRYDNRWWLFTETNPDYKSDTLRLYSADRLTGLWTEHPQSPVIQNNPHIARPAGRVIVTDNRIIRYTQDCFPDYGVQVRAFEITDLTPTSYQEQEIDNNPVLAASGHGWNQSGMHHIDPHRLGAESWLACVDGDVRQTPVLDRVIS
jgi:hypothetical protein